MFKATFSPLYNHIQSHYKGRERYIKHPLPFSIVASNQDINDIQVFDIRACKQTDGQT